MIRKIATSHRKPAIPNVARGAAKNAACDNAKTRTAAASIVRDGHFLAISPWGRAECADRSTENAGGQGLLVQASTASIPAATSNNTAQNRQEPRSSSSVPSREIANAIAPSHTPRADHSLGQPLVRAASGECVGGSARSLTPSSLPQRQRAQPLAKRTRFPLRIAAFAFR